MALFLFSMSVLSDEWVSHLLELDVFVSLFEGNEASHLWSSSSLLRVKYFDYFEIKAITSYRYKHWTISFFHADQLPLLPHALFCYLSEIRLSAWPNYFFSIFFSQIQIDLWLLYKIEIHKCAAHLVTLWATLYLKNPLLRFQLL